MRSSAGLRPVHQLGAQEAEEQGKGSERKYWWLWGVPRRSQIFFWLWLQAMHWKPCAAHHSNGKCACVHHHACIHVTRRSTPALAAQAPDHCILRLLTLDIHLIPNEGRPQGCCATHNASYHREGEGPRLHGAHRMGRGLEADRGCLSQTRVAHRNAGTMSYCKAARQLGYAVGFRVPLARYV